MTVRRVMGTETEYGVSVRGGRGYDPVRLSFAVVAAAADSATSRIRWDYRQEDPVHDARGGRLDRSRARADMLTDAPQLRIVNVIAANGGRIYVDHAHPEYSAPETTDPFQAVRYDQAGDVLMAAACGRAARGAGEPIELHRANVDGKGATWGTHESYLMLRRVPFEQVTDLLLAHLTTRQVYAGSGRVGIGETGEREGFQLSQRADYIHADVGLQTTFDRPVVNTRDESHAPDDRRRLHVIVGDANRMQVPQALKLGVTSLLLWALENGRDAGVDIGAAVSALAPADPVDAMHRVSHDLSLSCTLPTRGGEELTAWQIQTRLLGLVYEVAARIHGVDSTGEPLWPDAETIRLVGLWRRVLTDVAEVRHADDAARMDMTEQASRLEWLLKWQLLERLRRRHGCGWSDARVHAVDLAWGELGVGSIVVRLGRRMARVADDEGIGTAAVEPPETTRAWARSRILALMPERVVAVSWSRLTVRDDDGSLIGLDMSDPLAWSRAAVGSLLAEGMRPDSRSLHELFEALGRAARADGARGGAG
ncbi:depupylase/deamidase Dop [uncultured Bifidobacterium sp.]|uniref:depupylase/deamidase Dop n=1 Tax=uncultured Bifidobacterium sp. TaxID=165187 RepID=UPI0028DC9FF4|nr:depupylase/deamidase Dop [uncultured Bifidobacterium sp.]